MPESSTVPAKRKLRPARKQVKPGEVDKSEGIQAGKEYIISRFLEIMAGEDGLSMIDVWYNKWAGGDKEDPLASKTLSQTRCVIMRDAGYTRADVTNVKYCCLFFARGCCPYGHECNFLHRLPLPNHQLPDNSRDCFGREKHGEYRDDMGGVGSFNKVNRTIYIARMQESPDKKQTEETLLRHFGEWGKIVKWNVLHNRGIAFVAYESELNAQFAKEAMANQSMDMEEVLNVRWAIDDPNPGAIREEAKRIKTLGQEAIKGMLDENLVEAAQTIRALEDGDEEDFYPIEQSTSNISPPPTSRISGSSRQIEGGGGKRARIEAGEAAGDGPERKRTNGSSDSGGGGGAGGLLSEDAMENLKFYAEMARKQAEEDRARAKVALSTKVTQAKPAATGMALLGGYGSGDESD